ncbi:hypothetical protein LSH36_1777g00001 [Paralvinella palmiformis]|uniref:protein acetyllysine N-acetyltransferase n=1 Tax=Paralvinella palmiformis TaxID=53620 RepID=A0AAD9ISB3_9ANNE|nr:hypothetical protein LSH36_1777g00001 [Paralvinella palmiformis]
MAQPTPLDCCLRKCIQGDLDTSMSRVEVRTFDSGATDEERQSMEVCWLEDNEAVFHDICWKALLDSVRSDNPFTLSRLEKELLKEAAKSAEYCDSYQKVQYECSRVARMLKSANYAVMFTGAGISTSAGIGDFRGKAGKWTERDRERMHGASKNKRSQGFVYEQLRPTYTHEAIYKLLQLGYIKYIISQNTDSLHRLSGVPRDKISELHGNSFHEKCEKCGARYERPYAMRLSKKNSFLQPRICVHCHFNHRTGRRCERKGCDGLLINTIINFGDSLEKRVLSTADEHAKKSDLILCLGSSLRVIPASDFVEKGQPPLRLVLCNRQPTPFDHLCYTVDENEGRLGSRIFYDCDSVMHELMKLLLLPDDLSEWEDGREKRMEQYAAQREMSKNGECI